MKKILNFLLIAAVLTLSGQIVSASTTAGNLLTDIFNDRSIVDEMGGWYTDDLKITGTTTQKLGSGEYFVSWTLERVRRADADDEFRFEYSFDGKAPQIVRFSGIPQEEGDFLWIDSGPARGSDRRATPGVGGGRVDIAVGENVETIQKKTPASTPVPGTLLLFGSGLLAFAGLRRGRQ